jgi:Clp protease
MRDGNTRPNAALPLQINTVAVGVAIGQSCMLLSAGTKGKRFMLPHATGMYHLCRTASLSIITALYRGLHVGLVCCRVYSTTCTKCMFEPCHHAMRAAMLHQPRVPPTGQRQAVEIAIKWKEVLAQKNAMLEILSKTTGHSPAKLDKVRHAPLHCFLQLSLTSRLSLPAVLLPMHT